MSFNLVLDALLDQLKANATLLTYLSANLIFTGDQEVSKQDALIVVEPLSESEEPPTQTYGRTKTFIYDMVIYICKYQFGIGEEHIVGHDDSSIPGILDMLRDVKRAIRADLTLGYNQAGRSVSAAGSDTSYVLTANARYISVSINGRTPSGYNQIDCGSSMLTGTQIASTIQAALRALGDHRGDGYTEATCTYDESTKKFTIGSETVGAGSTVAVSAGAEKSADVVLGFDNPTETRGRQIIDIQFESALINYDQFPLVKAALPIVIQEDWWVGVGT